MAAAPRHLNLLIRSCDDCPLCLHVPRDGLEDGGWDCQHPQGSFRIVDEGDARMMADYHGVCQRLGKLFPDRCPLQIKPVTQPPIYRERSIELEALGGQEESG